MKGARLQQRQRYREWARETLGSKAPPQALPLAPSRAHGYSECCVFLCFFRIDANTVLLISGSSYFSSFLGYVFWDMFFSGSWRFEHSSMQISDMDGGKNIDRKDHDPISNVVCWIDLGMQNLRAHIIMLECIHVAMGQNPVTPVNIPIPTKID